MAILGSVPRVRLALLRVEAMLLNAEGGVLGSSLMLIRLIIWSSDDVELARKGFDRRLITSLGSL